MFTIRFTRKRILASAVAVTLVALLVFALRPKPLVVESALVSKGLLVVTLDEDGRTRAANRYVITAPVAGRLQRIALREGAKVSAGQVIARIAALPFDVPATAESQARLRAARARREAAAAALEQAEAEHAQAARELDRRRRLLDVGALAPEQVERYQLDLTTRAKAMQSAREAVIVAEAEASAAAIQESARTGSASMVAVVAPAGGNVLRIPEYSERIVAAGEPLLEVGDAATLEVVIDVLSSDAVRVRPGMNVILTEWGGAPLTARVRSIEPAAFTRLSALGVEEQRVNLILDFDDCPDTLGDGYRVQASITVWSSPSVLIVPASALFRAANAWSVFVIERGRAVQKAVTIGERGSAGAQVLAGLQSGERVILFPGDQLARGARVRFMRD